MEILNFLKNLLFPSSEVDFNSLSISGLDIFILKGDFDLGYCLDQHRKSIHKAEERTKIGELLFRFKYKYEKSSGEVLASLLASFIENNKILCSSELLLTVPHSFTSRPFDPMNFLAEKVCLKVQIPFIKNAFERTKIIKLQKDIFGMKSKIKNIKGAFKVIDPSFFKRKRILLLDDVYDSGATLNELSRILKSCGAENVFVSTLTKTGYQNTMKIAFVNSPSKKGEKSVAL